MAMSAPGSMTVPVVVLLLAGSFEGATSFHVPRASVRSQSAVVPIFESSSLKPNLEGVSAITDATVDDNEADAKRSLGGIIPETPETQGGDLTEAENATILDWGKDESLYDAETVVQAVIETAFEGASSEASLDASGTEKVTETKSGADQWEVQLNARTAATESTSETKAGQDPKTTTTALDAPSVGRILRFAIPAIGIWLCGPLLSMIDTGSVGLLSGTFQQAALSPAVAVTDCSAILAAFMFTGATNLVASSREADLEADREAVASPSAAGSRTQRALVASLQLSTFVGTGLGSVVFLFARPILRLLIGNDRIEPVVFAAALRYVRIRALGAPAAVIIGSAQSSSLGMQDVRSPLYVLLAAAFVNFMGDMLFVPNSNPWVGGAAGAAWATVLSQYAAVFFFMRWLTSKPNVGRDKVVPTQTPTKAAKSEEIADSAKPAQVPVNLTDAILELMGDTEEEKGKSRREEFSKTLRSSNPTVAVKTSLGGKAMMKKMRAFSKPLFSSRRKRSTASTEPPRFSTRGFLSDQLNPIDLVRFPRLDVAKEFLPYVMPVTTSSLGRVAAFVAMNHVVSSTMGTAAMAAQQIILSFFFCLVPVADSLSQTAQSFTPRLYQHKPSRARSLALRKATLNFWKAGGLFGTVMTAAVACIPLLSSFFSKDAAVVAGANSAAPLLAAVFAVHGIVLGTEGMLLGRRDLAFLGRIYVVFCVGAPLFMLRVKRAVSPDLRSVWRVFAVYQMVRLCSFVGRLWMVQRRTERQSSVEKSATV